MTTPALPLGYLARMRSLEQAVKWTVTLSEVRQFRSYCCNMNIGVAKQPVVELDISPNPVCLGDAVDWDFAGSYAPGSAITSYAIDMGDGTSYWGASGNHTYAAVGVYTVKGTVTEGTGRYTTVKIEVEVVDCDHPPAMKYAYTAYDGEGVYFIDFTEAVPAWVPRNTGLTGWALYVRDLGMRPHTRSLPDTVHELWACTAGGVYRSFNGGRSWRKMNLPEPSTAEFGADPVVGGYVFLTDLEGWSKDASSTHAGGTVTWEAADGSPANGCMRIDQGLPYIYPEFTEASISLSPGGMISASGGTIAWQHNNVSTTAMWIDVYATFRLAGKVLLGHIVVGPGWSAQSVTIASTYAGDIIDTMHFRLRASPLLEVHQLHIDTIALTGVTVEAYIDYYNVCFDPVDKKTVYILAAKTNHEHIWVYKTSDLGVSWTSRGVVTT